MQYAVSFDGVVRSGTPSGQLLLSLSMFPLGYHTVSLTSSPSPDGGILTFESATVTVETGLTE